MYILKLIYVNITVDHLSQFHCLDARVVK